MIICRTKEQLRAAILSAKKDNKKIGFVPTMGYLHDGHASLMRKAREENDTVVLSIFVNPMQFGPNEDLDKYPRDEARDLALAKACKVDIVFLPTPEVMYPEQPYTKVIVNEITTRLCGASRPGHFDGVGLVVSKLFNLVQPHSAYFGMKDAQQVAVIAQMVDDLDFPVNIVPCPIIREPDGLALSSRNVYLSAAERAQATVLYKALAQLEKELVENKNVKAGQLKKQLIETIEGEPLAEIDYVEIVSYPLLTPLPENIAISEHDKQKVLVALAVKFGQTRLIDNALFEIDEVITRV